MNDACVVRSIETECDLMCNVERGRKIERFTSDQNGTERIAVDALHRHIGLVFELTDVVNANDISMGNFAGKTCLTKKSLDRATATSESFRSIFRATCSSIKMSRTR